MARRRIGVGEYNYVCDRKVQLAGAARWRCEKICNAAVQQHVLGEHVVASTNNHARARMVTARSDGGGGSAQMRQEVEDAAKSVEPRREAIDGAQ